MDGNSFGKGEFLESRLEFRLVPKLRHQLKLRKTKIMLSIVGPSDENFFDEIADALLQGIIAESQWSRIHDACMIITGVHLETKEDVWVAIKASRTADFSDVDMAKELAEILSVVYGAAAEAVAACYQIPESVEEYAKQNGVRVIWLAGKP